MDNTYIRYSEAFKRKVVGEVESGRFSSMHAASKAYGINGNETVVRWMRRYGDESKLPKKVRIETVEEKDELKEAKKRVRQLEEEVADIYMDYSLERAFLNIACERMGTDSETFKKTRHDAVGAAKASESDMKLHVDRLCEKVGMSRQNFYKGRKARSKREVEGEKIAEKVKRERKTQERIGGRKLHLMLAEELKREDLYVGRDLFFDVLREHGLLVEKLPKAPCTTNSNHNLPVFSNMLGSIHLDAPNMAWASDITFLRVRDGFVYLSLTTDMYSRNIVGWNLSETMKAEDTLNALEMALANKPGDARPIHHSDRGSQYCSHIYVEKLREHGLDISMTEKDHCAENALAERLNGILKQEYGLRHVFASFEDALRAVEQAVWIYNHKRPHTSLGMQTPEKVHIHKGSAA